MITEKKDYLFDLLDDLNILYNTLKNNKKLIEQEFDNLLKEVAVYKTRINYDPDVKLLLDILQKHEHEKSVGAYERLLSALLQDVLPGDRKVLMDLTTERGVSSLNITIKKGDNPPEDPYNGNGGSVSNVLSVGLRLIALVRSGKRRFMVLDEADCWIKPILIPRFANVIQEMSERMGLQVLMISHHDDKNFACLPYRLQINKTDFGIETEWAIESESPVWNDEDDGFRSIMLSNFQAHSNTFIPLSPGITLLMGDNDIGKSSIVSALRAVFYGESDDSVIKHYEPSTKVTVDMGNGKALFWERKFGKGSPKDPKEVYTLIDINNGYDLDNPLHRTEGAKYLPEWLEEETGIGLIDGLDVQIGHQKKPIFLLDQAGSVRAKALAIGSDSSYVQKMMKLSKEEMSEAKTSIKNAEKTLERFQRNLIALKNISNHADFFENDSTKSYKKKIDYLDTFLNKYTVIKHKWEECLFLTESFKVLDEIPEAPEIPELFNLLPLKDLQRKWSDYAHSVNTLDIIEKMEKSEDLNYDFSDSEKMRNLLSRWERTEDESIKYRGLNSVEKTPESNLHIESVELKYLLSDWKKTQKKTEFFEKLISSEKTADIELRNINSFRQLLNRWKDKEKEGKFLEQVIVSLKEKEDEINDTILNEFPICPTCKRPWDNEHKD